MDESVRTRYAILLRICFSGRCVIARIDRNKTSTPGGSRTSGRLHMGAHMEPRDK